MINKFRILKIPDDLYTQTGRESLKKLFSVSLPDCKLIDDLDNGQGQLNLDICRSRMKRGDWNLARNLMNE
jgi:hypothetical protein